MSEYEIGYMKPPIGNKFKPGQSGNKYGRPKGSKNTYKVLYDLLNQKITMVQDGKPVKIDKKTAILLQAVNSASKGEIKSLQILLPHMLAVDTKNENLENAKEQLSTDDQEIIKTFLKTNKDAIEDKKNDE
jgi:hypothetical protein